MAERLWVRRQTGTLIKQFPDTKDWVEADIDAELAEIDEIQTLSDAARQRVATLSGSFGTLQDFDDTLEAREWELRDIKDYFSYEFAQVTDDEFTGAWFSPEAIEDFCGENPPNSTADKAIDGDNATQWQHFQTHEHHLTFRLRGHPKRVDKIRLRYSSNEPARERLNNVEVRAARDLSQIDNPANVLVTGVNPTWPAGGNVWVEIDFGANFKSDARYLKIVCADTDDASNNIQIREIECRVATKLH